MDSNDANRVRLRDTPVQSSRRLLFPAQLPQYDRDTGSISSEDPLAPGRSTRSHSPAPPASQRSGSNTNTLRPVASPGPCRVAVLLSTSPARSRAFGTAFAHREVPGPVVSDLTPSGAQAHKTMPVSPSRANTLAHLSPSNQARASSGSYRGRGRPKGWKPARPYNMQPRTVPSSSTTAASTRQVRPTKPIPHPNGFPKRRGRPPKPPSLQPRDIYYRQTAPFIAFLCEWEGCKAELHNLATLRRHVYIVHGHHTFCRWGSCARKGAPDDFTSNDEFGAHVEEAHLVPFAWHIGDGPQNSSEAGAKRKDDIPDYLLDENGEQVTPSIKDQKIEDAVTYQNNRRRLKELITRRDENLPSDDSDQTMADDAP